MTTYTAAGPSPVYSMNEDGSDRQPAPPDDAGNAANGGWVVRVDGQAVYWAADGKISKRDSSGKVTELATDVAVDMALDATYVYWANLTTVRRIEKDGTGSIEDLASGSSLGRMAMDGGYLYWTEFGTPPAKNGCLRRTKLGGTKATETLVSGLDGAGGVAFDASAVYFTEQQAGLVWKMAK